VRIDDSFEVDAPLDRVWPRLLDVETVVPCLPGASLTEVVDDTHWKGTVDVKLGPVALTYRGEVGLAERDDLSHSLALRGSGTETHGKGRATTSVSLTASSSDSGRTRVDVSSEIALAGVAAQLSRGLLPQVAAQLTREFAANLSESMRVAREPADAGPAGSPASKPPVAATTSTTVSANPVRGFTLLWRSFLSWLRGSRR
jgi:carbon monoxide dehydrogenase subunit G